MTIRAKQAMVATLKVFNAIGLALLIALVFIVLARISAQAKQTHDDTTASTARIENDLNCLGRFFSQANRTNLIIQDLNSCSIQNTSTGAVQILTGPPPGVSTTHESGVSKDSTNVQPVTAPNNPQTTSEAPPTTTSAPPDPNPSILEKALSPITNLLGGL